ncbi:glycosyltransferase family 2 protein [Pseudomonas sp. RC10]|uniref:glycosyltransferase family 2 protein n=1 Tax=Pseudomonas bambusae TaxID=3139142 RepID=UPI00313970EF
MKKNAAIIVGFRPDVDVLQKLTASLLEQVDTLIVVDNGGALAALSAMGISDQVAYIDMGGNAGVGAALNAGFAKAISKNCEYVATFDQDSCASPTLIRELENAMCHARTKDPKCIAVGPAFHDRREGEINMSPFYRTVANTITPTFKSDDSSGLVETDLLITSGMYIKSSGWKMGLTYDESLFVDFTDTEWCFRARDKGYTTYGCTHIKMGHALSDSPPIKWGKLTFYRYTPLRRYFYFRNTVAILKKSYTPTAWKRRLFLGLLIRFVANIVIDRDRLQSGRMMIKGLYHGTTNKLGPATKI